MTATNICDDHLPIRFFEHIRFRFKTGNKSKGCVSFFFLKKFLIYYVHTQLISLKHLLIVF